MDVSDWSMCLTVLHTEISPDEQLFWLTDCTETVSEAWSLELGTVRSSARLLSRVHFTL